MVCRAGRVPTGGARIPVGTGAVDADERVTAAAVGAVGAPTAVGCGTGGATNVTMLAEAGGGSANPERKEAWRCFSALRAAAIERSWVSMAVTRAWHSRSAVWAVARWRPQTESLERRGRHAVVLGGAEVDRMTIGSVAAEAATWVRARPSSTSWREGRATSARCCAVRVSQTGAQWSKWGGGPPLAVRAARGTGAVGRSPGVRPVADPVLARRSVEPMGEKSKSGPDVGGGGDPVLVLMWAAVPEVGLVEGAVDDALDMVLREARKAARGVKTRGGSHER